MSGMLLVVFILGAAIAYANGANDVSKGIATLVGSGVSNYRRAILWGTLWTGAGGLSGAFLARAMVQTFGKGLLAAGTHATLAAALATLAGTGLWIMFATRRGLPVSTTHAIVGSIAGVASIAYGIGGISWAALGGKIILPLLISPVVSLLLTAAILHLWRVLAPNSAADCICLQIGQAEIAIAGGGVGASPTLSLPQIHLSTCTAGQKAAPGFSLNRLHWVTSGATCFARGMNDAPKIVAIAFSASLLAGAGVMASGAFFLAVTGGMVAGSWIAGQRVTEVLACKVTAMDHREGFIANLVTAALVGPGAALGLPMSTTHVASGAIMGVAAGRSGRANSKTIRDMLLAWVVTLPAAALLGIAVFVGLRVVGLH